MTVLELPSVTGGELRGSEGGWIDVRNPARSDEIVGRVPASTEREVRGAVDAAAAGFESWSTRSHAERGEVLRRAGALVREREDSIARAVTAEMGKTLAEARAETARSGDFLDYYGSLSRAPQGELLPDARDGVDAQLRAQPLGAVVAITPWNDPLLTPARKLAPALFAGNSVIIKPASETPLSTLLLATALHDAGIDGGAVNTVTGPASRVVDPLLDDDRIAAVTFTGSTDVGLDLQRRLAGRNLRLQTEMGGKNPAVVLGDADLDLTADSIAAAAFGQAGQRCTATSRVIVVDDVADALVERLIDRAERIVVGPGDAPDTTMGPLASERQMRSVLADVERAMEQGATMAFGTGRLTDGPLAAGWFVSPFVLTGVTPSMEIWRREVFGPVLTVTAVPSLAHAVEAANDSGYGLAAALFSSDVASTREFIERVEAGQVAVNLPTTGWDVHLPFGGWKLSGSGFKEQGLEGLRFYTRLKTVAVRAAA